MTADYLTWVQTQTDKLKAAMGELGRAGAPIGAVYFIPATDYQFARLALADCAPVGASDCLRFPGVGSRVAAYPLSALHSAIADQCQRLPVFPAVGAGAHRPIGTIADDMGGTYRPGVIIAV